MSSFNVSQVMGVMP